MLLPFVCLFLLELLLDLPLVGLEHLLVEGSETGTRLVIVDVVVVDRAFIQVKSYILKVCSNCPFTLSAWGCAWRWRTLPWALLRLVFASEGVNCSFVNGLTLGQNDALEVLVQLDLGVEIPAVIKQHEMRRIVVYSVSLRPEVD